MGNKLTENAIEKLQEKYADNPPDKPDRDAPENEKTEYSNYLRYVETTEQRTKRVLQPRINALVSDIDKLSNALSSSRYSLTVEQQTKVTQAIENSVSSLYSAIVGQTATEEETIEL